MTIDTVGAGNRVAVESSNLAEVGYNSEGRIMEVKFKAGSVYRYFAVPADVYNGLLEAKSKGDFFYRAVRTKGYSFERMPDEPPSPPA